MKTVTKLAGAGAAVAALALVAGPHMQMRTGRDRQPREITMEVTWKGGPDNGSVVWSLQGKTTEERASGRHWRRNLLLPHQGKFSITVAGQPGSRQILSRGQTVYITPPSTCTIISTQGTKQGVQGQNRKGLGCASALVVTL